MLPFFFISYRIIKSHSANSSLTLWGNNAMDELEKNALREKLKKFFDLLKQVRCQIGSLEVIESYLERRIFIAEPLLVRVRTAAKELLGSHFLEPNCRTQIVDDMEYLEEGYRELTQGCCIDA